MTTVDGHRLPPGSIPDVYRAIAACGGEELLRWRPCNGVYCNPSMASIGDYQAICSYIPHPHQCIGTDSGNARAVRRPCYDPHRVRRILIQMKVASSGGIPHMHRLITACRNN